MIESAAILKDASDASWRGPAIGSIGRPARAQPAWAAFSGGVDGFILAWIAALRRGAVSPAGGLAAIQIAALAMIGGIGLGLGLALMRLSRYRRIVFRIGIHIGAVVEDNTS
jgi:hypothetical protein